MLTIHPYHLLYFMFGSTYSAAVNIKRALFSEIPISRTPISMCKYKTRDAFNRSYDRTMRVEWFQFHLSMQCTHFNGLLTSASILVQPGTIGRVSPFTHHSLVVRRCRTVYCGSTTTPVTCHNSTVLHLSQHSSHIAFYHQTIDFFLHSRPNRYECGFVVYQGTPLHARATTSEALRMRTYTFLSGRILSVSPPAVFGLRPQNSMNILLPYFKVPAPSQPLLAHPSCLRGQFASCRFETCREFNFLP